MALVAPGSSKVATPNEQVQEKIINAQGSGEETPSDTILRNDTTYLTVGNPIGLVAVPTTLRSSLQAKEQFNAVSFVYWAEIVTDNVAVRAASTPFNIQITQERPGQFAKVDVTKGPLTHGAFEAMSKNYRARPYMIPPLLSREIGTDYEQINDAGAGLKEFVEGFVLPMRGLMGDSIEIASNADGAAGVGTTPTSARSVWEILPHYKPGKPVCGAKQFVQLVESVFGAVLAASTGVGAPSQASIQLTQPAYSNNQAFAFGVSCETGRGITATYVEHILGVKYSPSGLGPCEGMVHRAAIDHKRASKHGETAGLGFVGMCHKRRKYVPSETVTLYNGPVATGVAPSFIVAYLCEA